MWNLVLKAMIVVAAPFLASAASAQMSWAAGVACPAGTHYATVRHNIVKAGQWATFEEAVAAHNAWYASHNDKTTTKLARVIDISSSKPALSVTEAVTITHYSNTPQPAHDAGFQAFTAQYRASAAVKDEARICLP